MEATALAFLFFLFCFSWCFGCRSFSLQSQSTHSSRCAYAPIRLYLLYLGWLPLFCTCFGIQVTHS
ncbi:hypothetical protein B0T26DRAFT_688079 [Lasiosphaeria miniovina]|uniref:Secreted peptide n=1 Tax=Lasiosphaeria miniovina TaxID=1954250 RepID=A0AA40BHV3_9PEZI|nr:uncharacterized protein B0T26DRAFT_688079 [Lasiosphaeria miniovina]KAK0734318.1 hypothetical protein B0T26DRAFT_688079 [Lasiosphaeria miniovina]